MMKNLFITATSLRNAGITGQFLRDNGYYIFFFISLSICRLERFFFYLRLTDILALSNSNSGIRGIYSKQSALGSTENNEVISSLRRGFSKEQTQVE